MPSEITGDTKRGCGRPKGSKNGPTTGQSGRPVGRPKGSTNRPNAGKTGQPVGRPRKITTGESSRCHLPFNGFDSAVLGTACPQGNEVADTCHHNAHGKLVFLRMIVPSAPLMLMLWPRPKPKCKPTPAADDSTCPTTRTRWRFAIRIPSAAIRGCPEPRRGITIFDPLWA